MGERKAKYTLPNDKTLEIIHGDLTAENVDAIVNAANSYLQHGGGVAAAIVRKGGSQIQKESDDWIKEHGMVHHDHPAYTSAGHLPAKYVIHAVGPVWGDGDEDAKLAAAVRGSLKQADDLGLSSIALPPISTGIFGFPKDRAARIFRETIQSYFEENPSTHINLVHLTIIDHPTLSVFLSEFEKNASQ